MIKILKFPIHFWIWVLVGSYLTFMGFRNNESMFSFEFVYGLISLLMAFFASTDEDIKDLGKRIKKLENKKL